MARSYFYWPSMDWVNSCHSCQKTAKSPTHTKSTSRPEAPGPWYRIHVDYAGPLNGEWYLVIVDSFSKWPEVNLTSSTTTTATIIILRNIFARFGHPVTLVSDNGPQFSSTDFTTTTTTKDVKMQGKTTFLDCSAPK